MKHEELREEVRAVARERVRPRVEQLDEDSGYPSAIHRILAEEELLARAIPAEHGGTGPGDGASFCVVVEELGRVSGAVSLIAAYVKLVALPLLIGASTEQKDRWLPPLASGEQLGSYALSEPHAGSDPGALRTEARRDGDEWVLDGEKRFIGNAGLSDLLVVFARTSDDGAGGISAFGVPGDADGVSAEPLETMGLPGWQLGSPRFDGVRLDGDALIGREGDGFKLAMRTFDLSRPTVGAQAVGIAQGALDLALDYATRRHAFGQALSDHEGIQFKLAEMDAEIAAARALTYQAAEAADAGDPDSTRLSAAAKLIASDTAMRVTTEAVQVLGGNGYLREFPAERMMRDAKVLQIYEGANEIQKLVIARALLEQAGERDPIWPGAMPGAPGVAAGTG